jgi:hypothetical protein
LTDDDALYAWSRPKHGAATASRIIAEDKVTVPKHRMLVQLAMILSRHGSEKGFKETVKCSSTVHDGIAPSFLMFCRQELGCEF